MRCGFSVTSEDSGFSNARRYDLEEFVLTLSYAISMRRASSVLEGYSTIYVQHHFRITIFHYRAHF
ncbi:hypothetical protein FC700_28075 [Bacillus mycoides]|nr:hypothetical protein FC700_28075 [Bacillus mycoides]